MSAVSKTPLLVLAAGRSERFRAAGFERPKPCIRFTFQGTERTMIEHAAADWDGPIVVVARASDMEYFAESQITKASLLEYVWLSDAEADVGQAASAQLACRRAEFLEDTSCVVVNCDQKILYPLDLFADQARLRGLGALVHHSADPSRSYVNGLPLFDRCVEKKVISPWAMTGGYYFGYAEKLAKTIERMRAEHGAGELYLSGAFEHYRVVRTNSNVGLAVLHDIAQVHFWGTPQELMGDPQVTGVRITG